jgi:trans-aconitate 2-methyltransferase
MKMADWNPEHYLKYEKERGRPALDLIARVGLERPARIIDIGCGSGNSTLLLKKRYPGADIMGLDYSPAMIERAKTVSDCIHWVQGDASGDLSALGLFDLVFSNAAIQWIPGHESLLPNLFGLLRKGGVLAVQVPRFEQMPVHDVMRDVALSPRWAGYFANFDDGMHSYGVEAYGNILSSLTSDFELWMTDYFHLLENDGAIIDFIGSTGMRPYLGRLPGARHAEYQADVLAGIAGRHDHLADGRVLFGFKRLFLRAVR